MSETAVAYRTLRSPCRFYGGKGQITHLIVPLLPPHSIYVEPFFGGGSVLFAKPPAALETINDLDSGVVGFYRVLRDLEQFAAFQRLAAFTPYSREEYMACRATWRDEADPVKRAWAWFVMVRMAYGGGGRTSSTGFKAECRSHGDGSSFGYNKTAGSTVRCFLTAVEHLAEVHERLQGVQIEHGDWRRVLAVYGVAGACVYLDPPYVLQTRTGGRRYACEMTLDDHHDLTEALLASPAMCVLSGYRYPAVHGPLEAAGWERRDIDVKLNISKRDGVAPRRLESIWRNPAALDAWQSARAPLFAEVQS